MSCLVAVWDGTLSGTWWERAAGAGGSGQGFAKDISAELGCSLG